MTVLVLGVREPKKPARTKPARAIIHWRDLAGLGGHFWLVVAVATILTLARFSEAFLVLRAEELGLPLALVPLVLIIMNVVFAATAYPMGVLADRIDRRHILAGGFLVLTVADLLLAACGSGFAPAPSPCGATARPWIDAVFRLFPVLGPFDHAHHMVGHGVGIGGVVDGVAHLLEQILGQGIMPFRGGGVLAGRGKGYNLAHTHDIS